MKRRRKSKISKAQLIAEGILFLVLCIALFVMWNINEHNKTAIVGGSISENEQMLLPSEKESETVLPAADSPATDIHATDQLVTDSKNVTDGSEIPVTTTMKVHFIDIGQGDAILVESAGHFMLIDAGDNKYGNTVVKYLSDAGVEKLDYVIGTHPHADHIGGMDKVIDAFEIGCILLPDITTDTKSFMDVLEAIKAKSLKITKSETGTNHILGDANFTIIAPNDDYGDELNNWSIGIRLVNGQNAFLLSGDAEKSSEEDMIASGQVLKADVLKLNHHGSDTASCDAFLDVVNPKYIIISCGMGNDYGHPHNKTITKIADRGLDLYRTDLQGTIIATSDGTNITFNVDTCKNFTPGQREVE